MKLNDFLLENWLNPLDPLCTINLGASCVKALHLDELFEITGEDMPTYFEKLSKQCLGYSNFHGSPRLKEAISKLYKDVDPDMIVTTHGGIGANDMILTEFSGEGGNVVAILPNYQQHYEIPRSLGTEVRIVKSKRENDYVLDMDDVRAAVDENTILITLSSPCNPTGVYLEEPQLKELASIAREVGAYILCDEIYRNMREEYMPSIADIYEKGIVSSSVSKVYSLAATRVGWLVVRDPELKERLMNRREYSLICNSPMNEELAAIALEHHKLLEKRGRDIVAKNLEVADAWLATHPHFKRIGKVSGTTTIIAYDYDIDSRTFCQGVFDMNGLLLSHGDCFEEPHSVRMGLSFDDGETLGRGLALLDEYLTANGME